ncbi:MAG: hypothetical protein HN742_25855 [Lentisphaerae bacterium]|nr:hypothetical protein [Lentisphaerota bacterium]MBT4815503.1 hypothetical protein [Lentisphaerota bacterium]MBT5606514.1 hypothetical protein [Lentisphaerota bacterium]MBT7060155.1 hypothetical protein [Lentisphaerota bacterium]MBT7845326.1 hypothetical protein [Lentisphaerota bacterium]
MTKRAIILGLLCAAFIAGFCYFHDCVINPGARIRLVPHLMPHIVYGALLFAVLGINPLLKHVLKWKPLGAGELALVVALALVACSVPFYGMVHCWPSALMLPHHYERVSPGWQREGVLQLAPKAMLADVSKDETTALTGYVTGLSVGSDHAAITDIPWSAWLRPMLFWVPLVLSITIACIALSVVIHRQWAHHEQLPYPISQFTHALLPGDGPSVLRSRGFIIAATAVFAIHMVNYAHAWWPQYLIPIKLRLDLSPALKLVPELLSGDGRSLLYPRVIFAVIGITYFFASDVSFSLAIAPVFMCYVCGVLTGYGLSVTKGFSLFHNSKVFLYFGGYLGIFLMSVYTGRHLYGNVLRRSLGMQSSEDQDPALVWAMRIFLAGAALFCLLLMIVGLDWPFALFYTGVSILVFTVISRSIAETGGFYIGTWILPGSVLWGLLGGRAVGPRSLVIMVMVSIIVLVGPGWAPMPFVVQSLKIADMTGLRVRKTAIWCGIALVLAMAIAIPATIYWQYDGGVMRTASGWARYTPRLPFDQAVVMQQQLAAQGLLDSASETHGWARLSQLAPSPTFWAAFGIGTVLSVLIYVCRLRFPWWPIHPIVFVFLGTHQAQRLAFSFLLGWAIKTGIYRYGGARLYQSAKPVMIGLIAGEVAAGTVPMVFGVLYYAITGDPPVNYSLLL